MVATAEQIATGARLSTLDMFRQLGWVKVFSGSIVNINGVQCKIYRDPADPAYDAKRTGLETGLRRVMARGFTFPNGITFYCSNMAGVQSIAFHRAPGGGRQSTVLLGAACTDASNPGQWDGIAHKVAPLGGANYCAAVVTHELGHNLHETASEGLFWDAVTNQVPEPLSNQVSNYAAKNKLEFVAEVFTGCMYGRAYAAPVMARYAALGGPTSPTFP
jgi:hypothetical protein